MNAPKNSKKPESRKQRAERWSSVDIPTELWEKVETEAKRQYLKPSQLVRRILAQHLGLLETPVAATGTGS